MGTDERERLEQLVRELQELLSEVQLYTTVRQGEVENVK